MLLVACRDRLPRLPVTFGEKIKVEPLPTVTDEQKAHLDAWLGSTLP